MAAHCWQAQVEGRTLRLRSTRPVGRPGLVGRAVGGGELALVGATSDQFRELPRFPTIQSKTWNHSTDHAISLQCLCKGSSWGPHFAAQGVPAAWPSFLCERTGLPT